MAFLSYAVVFIFPLFQGAFFQEYQWECSALDSTDNLFYLPAFDFGGSGTVLSNFFRVISSSPGATYIYPVNGSQLNCSGTVTGVEYCYRGSSSDYGTEISVFTLSMLMQDSTGQFTVTDITDIRSTPTSTICSSFFNAYCCDITLLNPEDQFQLPSQNFAYALTIPSSGFNLLGWRASSYPQYVVRQYRSSVAPIVGGVYVLDSNDLITDEAHRLLRFLITPLQSSSIRPLPSTTMSTSSTDESSTSTTPSVSVSVTTMSVSVTSPVASSQFSAMVSLNPITIVTLSTSSLPQDMLPSSTMTSAPSSTMSDTLGSSTQQDNMPSSITMATAPLPTMSETLVSSTQPDNMVSSNTMTTPSLNTMNDAVASSAQQDNMAASSTITIVASSTMSDMAAASTQPDNMASSSTMTTEPSSTMSDMAAASTQPDNMASSSTMTTEPSSTMSDMAAASTQPDNMVSSSTMTTEPSSTMSDMAATSSIQPDNMASSSTMTTEPSSTMSDTIVPSTHPGDEVSSSTTTSAPSSTMRDRVVLSTQQNSILSSTITNRFITTSIESIVKTLASSVLLLSSDTTTKVIMSTAMMDTVTSSNQQDNVMRSSIVPSNTMTLSPSSTLHDLMTSSTLQTLSSNGTAPVSTYSFDSTGATFLSSFPLENTLLSDTIKITSTASTMVMAITISSSQPNNIESSSPEADTPSNVPSTISPSSVQLDNVPSNFFSSSRNTISAMDKTAYDMTTPMETMDAATTRQTLGAPSSGVSNALIGGVVGGVLALLIVILSVIFTAVFIMKWSRFKVWEPRTRSDPGLGFTNAIYTGDDTLRINGDNKIEMKSLEYDYAGIGPRVSDLPITKRRQEDTLPRLPFEDRYASVDSKLLSGGHNEKFYESLHVGSNPSQYNPSDMQHERIYMAPATDVSGLYAQLDEIMMDTDIVTRDNIKLGKLLGSGQFGDVYKGIWEHTAGDVEVAVKTLKKEAVKEDRVKFLQEAAIMGQFRHPNVVTMYGVVTDGEPVLLVLEMLKKGDLRQYLISMRLDDDCERISPDLDGHVLLSFCRQIVSGMAYLSNKAFVHRDLAARNVLVAGDGICKIADFGMSRDLADENYYVSHGGKIPVKWTAPEALHYKKYSTASDVWSFGVVMYEIWSVGHKPFEGIANDKVLLMVESGYRLPPPPGCPRAIYNIMMSCWALKVNDRPQFSKLCIDLSYPDTKLLHWSDDEKTAHSDAARLGSKLHCTEHLFRDLQMKFIPDNAMGSSKAYEDIVVHY